MKLFGFASSVMALVLPLNGVIATGLHGIPHHARHADIARRVEGDVQLWKRIEHSRWSFYDVGLGACGKHNVPSDFIVALNSDQFGSGYPGPHCFKMITMRYNGKTTKAQIVDRCPGCGYGGLDLSRGLFRFFDSEDKGLIYGSWSFDGEGAPAPAPTTRRPAPRPPTTTQRPPRPTPTTTRRDPITISTPDLSLTRSSRTSTRTRADSTSSSASTSSGRYAGYTTGVASGLGAPVATGIIEQDKVYNINDMNRALVGLGELILAGAEAE